IYLIKTDPSGNSCTPQGSVFIPSINPAAQVTSPATIVTSVSMSVTSPVITDSSGGLVATVCLTVGINEISNHNYFLISPNPSLGKFSISFEAIILQGNVEILNIVGEKV